MSSAVSVVIPAFNSGVRIDHAIRSVINQRYQAWELIVVDDGSTDNTVERVMSFKDPKVKLVRHDVNRGAGAARNTGTHYSTGEFVAFLDHDDRWLPDKPECQIQFINKHRASTDVRSCSRLYEDWGSHALIRPRLGKATSENVSEYIIANYGLMQTSAVIASRSMIDSVSFPDRSPVDDIVFVMQAEEIGAQFIFCPEPLVVWNRRPDNYSFSSTSRRGLFNDWIDENRSRMSRKAQEKVLTEWIWPMLQNETSTWNSVRRIVSDRMRYGDVVSSKTAAIGILAVLCPGIEERVRVRRREANDRMCLRIPRAEAMRLGWIEESSGQ